MPATPRTVYDWTRLERRRTRIAGGVLLALGVLLAVVALAGVADSLESGETTVYRPRSGSYAVLRTEDPAGFHARVFGGSLLLFAVGSAFAAFGRGLVGERALPPRRGFDAKWELDNAQRRPLDPSA